MSDLASARPLLPQDSDESLSEQISTNKTEALTWQNLLDTSGKEQLAQFLPPCSGFNLKSAPKIALLVVLATTYLTFCFIVRHGKFSIGGRGFTVLGLPLLHFTTEASITTISIVIISVALSPIRGLVDEIRSEEFFRILGRYPDGVPLSSANAPINGPFDVILATIRRHCSGLLTSTLAITLAIIATSSLAPSTLSTESVLIDIDDPSFMIGAVPPDCFMVTAEGLTPRIAALFPEASSMSWVENKFNITSTYYRVASSEGDPFGWIVPFPPKYTTAMKAYWTTDIIVMNPSCSWQTARTIGPFSQDLGWRVTLAQANSSLYVGSNSFVPNPSTSVTLSVAILLDDTEGIPISDGSVGFVLSQFNGPPMDRLRTVPPLDLSDIPTLQFSDEHTLAFLVCSPNASIQTREVRTNGSGIFDVGQPQRTSQGNLDLDQINYLLSHVLMNFDTDSGPHIREAWTEMMLKLIFGENFVPQLLLSAVIPPAPLANITAVYKQAIQSAMKSLMSGAIATANVTGGYRVERVVFKSSSGHLMASTILFALLTLALVVAQFRTGREAFNLIDVAAALDDSDVPRMCGEMKQLAGVSDRKILTLVRNDDGGLNLNILTRASTEV